MLKSVNYVAFSEYCVKSGDRDVCCHKIRIYTALALYALVLHSDWVSTKQLYKETRIPYEYLAMALRKLERYGLAERVYVPGAHGVASMWKIRGDVLDSYDKKLVLNVLKKYIKMCLA